MKSKLLYGMLGILFLFMFALFWQSSQRILDRSLEVSTSETVCDANKIRLSDSEMISQATHILDAEYLGTAITEYGTELMFRPSTLYKGEIEDEIIYVQLL